MIFHLTVIIVLLAVGIDNSLKPETSFVLDFSKQEEIERQQREEIFKEDISRKLDDMIRAAQDAPQSQVRNIAVDAGSTLKDDRGTDADQLYKDAARLAQELKDVRRMASRRTQGKKRCRCSIRGKTTPLQKNIQDLLSYPTLFTDEKQVT